MLHRLTSISGIKIQYQKTNPTCKGPGKTGKKLPMIPKTMKAAAILIKKNPYVNKLDSKRALMLQNLTVC